MKVSVYKVNLVIWEYVHIGVAGSNGQDAVLHVEKDTKHDDDTVSAAAVKDQQKKLNHAEKVHAHLGDHGDHGLLATYIAELDKKREYVNV